MLGTDIGSGLKLLTLKAAAAQAAGTVSSDWVDVKSLPDGMFDSAIAIGGLGTSANSPTSQTLSLKIRDATDSSGTGAADYKPDGTNTAQSATGISGVKADTDGAVTQLNFSLRNARKFVQVQGVLAFVGGSSPTQTVTVGIVAGGGQRIPTTPPNA